MNKIKVVALATLFSITGNFFALSMKNKAKISGCLGITAATITAAAYDYARLHCKEQKEAIKKLTSTKNWFNKKQNGLYCKENLIADGKFWLETLAVSEILGLALYLSVDFVVDKLLEGFTVQGLVNRVDKDVDFVELILEHPDKSVIKVDELEDTIKSLLYCQNTISEYFNKTDLKQQVEDGFLHVLMERKEKIDELLVGLYEVKDEPN